MKIISKILNMIKILDPDEIFLIFWNIFFSCFIFLMLIIIPFELLIEIKFSFNSLFFKIFRNYLTVCIYFFNIVISLNTGFYSKAIVIKDRIKIFKKYIKNSFFIDLIGFLPIIFKGSNIMLCFFVFQIIIIINLVNKLEEVLLLRDKWKGIRKFIKYI